VCVCVYIYIPYIYVYISVNISVYKYTYIYIYICTSVNISVYKYTYIYMCVCIYICTHAGAQASDLKDGGMRLEEGGEENQIKSASCKTPVGCLAPSVPAPPRTTCPP
jgi:hypothetical protein